MKKLLIRILLKIKVVRFLKDNMIKYGAQLGALCSVYPHLKREYYIKEIMDMFVVFMVVNEDRNITAIVKIFPKGDDPEYTELCAKELLDELNKEV